MKLPALMLHASHTHLYPGARLRAAGPLRAGAAVWVEFADLGGASARVDAFDGEHATLSVQAHRTARGTAVGARRWLLAPAVDDDGSPVWRVLRRVRV